MVFRTFFDPGLTKETPYHQGNPYVRSAQPRMEATIGHMGGSFNGVDILDLGASPFYFLWRCQELGAARVEGVFYTEDTHPLKDNSKLFTQQGAIGICHRNILKEPLPYETDSFDLVTAFEIFEHFPIYPSHLLSEITRVLRPDGRFFLSVPNVCYWRKILKLILGRNIFMPYRSDPYGRHSLEYTFMQCAALLGAVNGENLRMKALPPAEAGFVRRLERRACFRLTGRWLGSVILGEATVPSYLSEQEISRPPELVDQKAASNEGAGQCSG